MRERAHGENQSITSVFSRSKITKDQKSNLEALVLRSEGRLIFDLWRDCTTARRSDDEEPDCKN